MFEPRRGALELALSDPEVVQSFDEARHVFRRAARTRASGRIEAAEQRSSSAVARDDVGRRLDAAADVLAAEGCLGACQHVRFADLLALGHDVDPEALAAARRCAVGLEKAAEATGISVEALRMGLPDAIRQRPPGRRRRERQRAESSAFFARMVAEHRPKPTAASIAVVHARLGSASVRPRPAMVDDSSEAEWEGALSAAPRSDGDANVGAGWTSRKTVAVVAAGAVGVWLLARASRRR